jgi:hypothetical protein
MGDDGRRQSLKKEKRGERTKMNSHRRISGLLSQ